MAVLAAQRVADSMPDRAGSTTVHRPRPAGSRLKTEVESRRVDTSTSVALRVSHADTHRPPEPHRASVETMDQA